MNDESKSWILFEVQDAIEALESIRDSLLHDPEYDETLHRIKMAHAFGHVNAIWNARHAVLEDIENDENFEIWKRFPDDIEPF